MIPFRVQFVGAGEFVEGDPASQMAELEGVVVLANGMASGRPSVSVIVKLPDGTRVAAQTSARNFVIAADMIKAKHAEDLE